MRLRTWTKSEPEPQKKVSKVSKVPRVPRAGGSLKKSIRSIKCIRGIRSQICVFRVSICVNWCVLPMKKALTTNGKGLGFEAKQPQSLRKHFVLLLPPREVGTPCPRPPLSWRGRLSAPANPSCWRAGKLPHLV